LGGSIYSPDVQLPLLPTRLGNVLDLTEEQQMELLDKLGFEIIRKFTDVFVSEKANKLHVLLMTL
jgi:hypothetical protein